MAIATRKVLLMLVLVTMMGGQWVVPQTTAWAIMLVNNLRTDAITQAVTRTFDGRHPCPICAAIAQGKKSEKKTEFASNLNRMEFPVFEQEGILVLPDRFEMVPAPGDEFCQSLSTQPLTPPPRANCA